MARSRSFPVFLDQTSAAPQVFSFHDLYTDAHRCRLVNVASWVEWLNHCPTSEHLHFHVTCLAKPSPIGKNARKIQSQKMPPTAQGLVSVSISRVAALRQQPHLRSARTAHPPSFAKGCRPVITVRPLETYTSLASRSSLPVHVAPVFFLRCTAISTCAENGKWSKRTRRHKS